MTEKESKDWEQEIANKCMKVCKKESDMHGFQCWDGNTGCSVVQLGVDTALTLAEERFNKKFEKVLEDIGKEEALNVFWKRRFDDAEHFHKKEISELKADVEHWMLEHSDLLKDYRKLKADNKELMKANDAYFEIDQNKNERIDELKKIQHQCHPYCEKVFIPKLKKEENQRMIEAIEKTVTRHCESFFGLTWKDSKDFVVFEKALREDLKKQLEKD